MAVWSSFLNHYNGQTLLTNDKIVSSNSLHLYTYAAQSKGFACIFQQVWSYGPFSDRVKPLHINILEL